MPNVHKDPTRKEEKLSEYGETDKDVEEKAEEAVEEARKEFSQEMQTRLDRIEKSLQKTADILNKLTLESQVLKAVEKPVEDPNVDVSDDEADSESKDMKDKEKSVIDSIWSKASEAAKTKTGKFFLAAFAIGASIGAEQLIDYIEQCLNRKNAPPPTGVNHEDYAKFKEEVEKWADMSDDEYWKKMARFAKKNNSTMADLLFFMQYTVKLFPAKKPFLWKKLSDQTGLAKQLVSNYNDTLDLPMWIEDLIDQKYQDKPLPRSVTAQVARLGLAQMIAQKA